MVIIRPLNPHQFVIIYHEAIALVPYPCLRFTYEFVALIKGEASIIHANVHLMISLSL